MNILDEHIKYYKSFNINELVNFAVKKVEGKISLYNKEQLYDKGIKNDNTPVIPEYTPLTIKLKKAKGQRTDHVTLKDTGAFYNSIFVVYSPNSFKLYARNNKTQKLVKKYGDDIFGITETNINKMNMYDVLPIVIDKINKDFGK